MSNRVWLVAALLLAQCVAAAETPLAFPGAVGAAAATPGGRGGEIVRVTTLAPSGPGSFAEAVLRPGKRIVVFEVGGVIDLAESTVRITEPYLTIAGQTAPAPGITLIRRHRHRHARRGRAAYPRAARRRRARAPFRRRL